MRKTFFLSFLTMSLLVVITSCTKESADKFEPLKEKTITNFYAPGGRFAPDAKPKYFSFETGAEVTSKNGDWDIAFLGENIYTNSGVSGKGKAKSLMLTNTSFAGVKEAPSDTELKEDKDGNLALGKWYSYNRETHILTPIKGNVLVVKTNKGNYAKMEILSFYKDKKESIRNSYYYTFVYKATKNGSKIFEK